MKKIIGLLIAILLSALIDFPVGNVFGADYNYDVSGSSGSGYVSGGIEANKGSKEVEGYLYTDDGREVYFEGEWTGHGEIEGYDSEGNYYELETN